MRVAVFVSGRGSNLKAFLDENLSATTFVFSNKRLAPNAFKWARRRGAVVELVELNNESAWLSLANRLNRLKISQICLLGFMKIIPEVFLMNLNAQIVNLHPSVLPDFPGLKSIEKSFEEKKSMGCTVHQVLADVDAGEVYLQKKILIPFLTISKFTEQVHQFEQDVVAKYFDLNPGFLGAV